MFKILSSPCISITQTRIPSTYELIPLDVNIKTFSTKTHNTFSFLRGFVLFIDALLFLLFLLVLFSHSPHLSNPSEIDDVHSVRDRPDNEHTRRPVRHSEDSGAYVTTLDRDSTIQTYLNRSPADSNLPTRMSTNISHLPAEERERRILDENTALKQVINPISS